MEVRATSGEVWATSGEPLDCLKIHSERSSGEVAEKLPGKFGELPGKPGDSPEARGSLTLSQRLTKFVSNSLDFRVFLDILKIFAEDCFLLRSFRKFLPSVSRTLKRSYTRGVAKSEFAGTHFEGGIKGGEEGRSGGRVN